MKQLRITILSLITVSCVVLSGCAGVVVGGAATGAAMANDRRSAGTMLDDQGIELKALDRLIENRTTLEGTHVNATSYNYLLLLTGEAPTAELRARIESIMQDISKVKRIQNEIAVAESTSLASRSHDSWITAKIKTLLFGIQDIEDFDPTRVKVVTENSVVYLMGLVTRREADAATEVVRKVTGVSRVVKIFEYID